jgi:hypothetical protein
MIHQVVSIDISDQTTSVMYRSERYRDLQINIRQRNIRSCLSKIALHEQFGFEYER